MVRHLFVAATPSFVPGAWKDTSVKFGLLASFREHAWNASLQMVNTKAKVNYLQMQFVHISRF